MFAINGFGRIGRCILRAYFENKFYNKGLNLGVVNCGFGTIEEHIHLLKYDSVHGKFSDIQIQDSDHFIIQGQKIRVIFEPDPGRIEWSSLGITEVIESTGKFTDAADAGRHMQGGAKNVIISAPAKGDVDATVVYGVNDNALDGLRQSGNIISAGSCTTNCLAPVLKAFLDGGIDIKSGFMTTIHAYTNDQNLIDSNHSDLRRARSATLSMIPSSTGAAKAIGLVLPQMQGRLDGVAVRVPVPNVSMIDLKLVVDGQFTVDSLNQLAKSAASGMKSVMRYEDNPLVSIDFNHDPSSAIFDATQTRVMVGDDGSSGLVRVVAWYDNEWGFSNRVLDILSALSALSKK